jgi:apolipoprotein N-acyltransferase
MLGHTMADVPVMIQIADLFGTYGVSFVLVSINVAVFSALAYLKKQISAIEAMPAFAFAITLVVGTTLYGRYRLGEQIGPPLATFALIQRDEQVEYGQDESREAEIFQEYTQQSMKALAAAGRRVDAVVWPESMFSGGAPWMTAQSDAIVPDAIKMTPSEFQSVIVDRKRLYLDRASYVQRLLADAAGSTNDRPHLIVGCGVVNYAQVPEVYSGVVHIWPDGSMGDWYGKTHLVMFGEYVPIAPSIPGIRSLIPPGMGLHVGPGAKRFVVEQTAVSPNVCIETAVERVTVNQLAELNDRDQMADVVITVTNDGWFDESSVITHHLRCAQLVAVGCRRPVLSAANCGPTAWIDSRGQLVQYLTAGTNGAIIAMPQRDRRISVYLRIGDWPVRVLLMICGLFVLDGGFTRWKKKRSENGLGPKSS